MTELKSSTSSPSLILTDPYRGIEKLGYPPAARINSSVAAEIVEFLMQIHPRPDGVIRYSVNILLHKLYHELRRRSITTNTSKDDFIRFMRDFELALPGEVVVKREQPAGAGPRPTERPLPNRSTPWPLSETTQPPDGRGAAADNQRPTPTSGQPSGTEPENVTKQAEQQNVKRTGRRGGVAQERSV